MKFDNIIVEKSKSIALKEASETECQLEILTETEYLSSSQFESMHCDIVELKY